MFGRATITLGIGPHSSVIFICSKTTKSNDGRKKQQNRNNQSKCTCGKRMKFNKLQTQLMTNECMISFYSPAMVATTKINRYI